MLYADPPLIGAALGGRSLAFVREPVFDDPVLRRVIAEAFAGFPEPIEDLEAPALVAALADALSCRAGAPPKTARVCAGRPGNAHSFPAGHAPRRGHDQMPGDHLSGLTQPGP